MADPNPLASTYALARERGALLDLSGRAKWHLGGADRVRYLNGQVTNDIRKIRPGEAMAACVTTGKGRLSGVIFVSAEDAFLRMDAEEELREGLAGRLERYIIADDVALEDVTEAECLFHVVGGDEGADEPYGACDGERIRKAKRFYKAGYDVIAPAADYSRLLTVLARRHTLVSPALAECLRIEAGMPRWGAELSEETLPPEARLDETAIDYHKGCYIGQEVISRIRSVGHVNRRLAGFTAGSPLTAGMTLHPAEDSARSAGEITSGAWSFGLETWAGLGYLKRGFADTELLARPPDGDAVAVQIRPLPLVP